MKRSSPNDTSLIKSVISLFILAGIAATASLDKDTKTVPPVNNTKLPVEGIQNAEDATAVKYYSNLRP